MARQLVHLCFFFVKVNRETGHAPEFTSERGQDPEVTKQGVGEGQPPAPDEGVVGIHGEEVGGLVDKGDGRRGDDAQGQRDEEAGDEDGEGVELAELVLAQDEEGDEGAGAVDGHRGDDGPHEHLVPDGWNNSVVINIGVLV